MALVRFQGPSNNKRIPQTLAFVDESEGAWGLWDLFQGLLILWFAGYEETGIVIGVWQQISSALPLAAHPPQLLAQRLDSTFFSRRRMGILGHFCLSGTVLANEQHA